MNPYKDILETIEAFKGIEVPDDHPLHKMIEDWIKSLNEFDEENIKFIKDRMLSKNVI